jgi:hypothetical protein
MTHTHLSHAAPAPTGRPRLTRRPAEPSSRRRRRLVMMVDGGFLTLAGTTQAILEVVGHHLGRGPLGRIFEHSPHTIGWVEAHGLAALIGLLFLMVGGRDGQRFWHAFALAVHALLGAANLIFWSSFVAFNTMPLGMLATAIHVAFIVAQTRCLASIGREDRP